MDMGSGMGSDVSVDSGMDTAIKSGREQDRRLVMG